MDEEWIEERATILEFEANVSRTYAENQAVQMWRRHCKDVIEFEKQKGEKWQGQ